MSLRDSPSQVSDLYGQLSICDGVQRPCHLKRSMSNSLTEPTIARGSRHLALDLVAEWEEEEEEKQTFEQTMF